MKRVLVSAFRPFGNDEINASEIILDILPEKYEGIHLCKVVLPVLYGKAHSVMLDEIKRNEPDYILAMGQAGGRPRMSLERLAVNINHSGAPDNDGHILSDRSIIAEGKTAYMTDIPVIRILQEIGEDNASVSYSAGTFVCNDLFYRLLHDRSIGRIKATVGFIHLPYTEHFGKIPFIDAKIQADTVLRIITALGDGNG